MSVVSLDLDLSTHVPPAAAAQSALPLRRPEFTGHALGGFGGGGVMERKQAGNEIWEQKKKKKR